MTRRRLPAASTWVLWSSPLLLVVLVLTLGATGRTATPEASRYRRPSSGARPVATTSTTAAARPTPRHRAGSRPSTIPLEPTTTTTAATRPNREPTRTVSAPSTGASSNSTGSSASASVGASATSAPVAGQLGAGLSSAVVPLAGPRTWTLASSAPLTATLACGAQATAVSATFVVGSTSCQLDLADPTAQTVTWQLTPDG